MQKIIDLSIFYKSLAFQTELFNFVDETLIQFWKYVKAYL